MTKLLVARSIPEHALVPVIPGLLNLTHTDECRRGLWLVLRFARGVEDGPPDRVSLALLGVVFYMVWKAKRLDRSAGLGWR